MKKQFHIKISRQNELVIDLNENESVSLYVDNPPIKFAKQDDPKKVRVKVDGLRWEGSKHFHLGWLEQNMEIGDEISLTLTHSNKPPSPIRKEVEYIRPEEDCNFCQKKKSEVEYLFEKTFLTRICSECIELATNELEKLRNET